MLCTVSSSGHVAALGDTFLPIHGKFACALCLLEAVMLYFVHYVHPLCILLLTLFTTVPRAGCPSTMVLPTACGCHAALLLL